MHVVTPVGRLRFPANQIGKTPGNRLDRRERIIQLVAQDAQQALPCGALFFAKRLTQISQHEQLKLVPTFAKRAATNVPTSNTTRKDHLHRLRWTTSGPR